MRSKKDRDTVVIVTTDTGEEMKKLLEENSGLWQEVKKPELDGLLVGLPTPNRAERRGQKFGEHKRGEKSGRHLPNLRLHR